jgi:predicted nuclease of predicted toxin-antitoxin system
MRFLANENFPSDAIAALRHQGHDVTWIRTDSPGIADPVVLARAQTELRILLTFDKDFGELAFRSKLPAAIGIVLFRVRGKSGLEIAQKVARVIASRDDWAGHFSVVEEHRIRVREL